MGKVGVQSNDGGVVSMGKAGNEGGAGSATFAFDQFQIRVSYFEFSDDRDGRVAGVVVDQEEFEVQGVFLGDGESTPDEFGKILGLILGRADDGEIHDLDYNSDKEIWIRINLMFYRHLKRSS